MATRRGIVGHLVEQAAGAGLVSARAMFGEYAPCCEGRLVALICDDRLFRLAAAGVPAPSASRKSAGARTR